MKPLSKAEKRALRLMASHTYEDGIINQHGKVICAGRHDSVDPATWLRLVSRKMVTGDGFPRLRLTALGARQAGKVKADGQ